MKKWSKKHSIPAKITWRMNHSGLYTEIDKIDESEQVYAREENKLKVVIYLAQAADDRVHAIPTIATSVASQFKGNLGGINLN